MIFGNDEKNIRDNTCNGECSRCGECCGLFIPFNDEDIEVIKEYVSKHNIMPYDRINKLTGGFEAHCCFYNMKEKKCMIYPVRPYVCRDFICNRKNWKQKRDEYERKAKYNSTQNKMIMATFDDMIYGNYTPILLFILEYCREPNGLVDSHKLVTMLKYIGREDLLKQFTATDENGKTFDGTELETID